jgi:hypothetical protein
MAITCCWRKVASKQRSAIQLAASHEPAGLTEGTAMAPVQSGAKP